MSTLGIDLGATNTKLVVLHDDDRIETLESFPTGGELGHDAAIARLVERVDDVLADRRVSAIGVGTPGLFDDDGVVTIFTNLPGQWIGVPLLSILESAWGLSVRLINDARAFTLAEGTLGAGKGARVMAGLTLGTGVGGGILIDGELFHGASGVAGEIAHQTVEPDGLLCGCGNRGCAEAAARAGTLIDATGRPTLEDVYRGRREGDRASAAAVERAAAALGTALANVITVVGPEVIVIGGGVVAALGDEVLDPIREATLARVTLVDHDRVRIVAASLGSEAGAVGAAVTAR